ncbi:MAG: peptide deformylase [Ignavibacteria bacterium]|jgi:peptide deformylase|nr:peptide deformylase [Ignavibacteria bacterium]MCU7504286.1 peptide deformylase [Ignavibacteria bacterium]MCU7516131.1 peptide deformylase [Ignavibacteria bacterium]
MKKRIKSKYKIVQFGQPVLREIAKPVTVFHHKLHELVDSLAETLYRSEDGAAIAAPQIGVSKRIVVIDYEDEYLELLNPEIISSSGTQTGYEGCLSLPGFIGNVTRAQTVKVKYQDRDGNEITIEKNGNLARCLQHEIDHLDGILFIDKVIDKFLVHQDTDEKLKLQDVLDLSNGKNFEATT